MLKPAHQTVFFKAVQGLSLDDMSQVAASVKGAGTHHFLVAPHPRHGVKCQVHHMTRPLDQHV